jgi:hypothetical protein
MVDIVGIVDREYCNGQVTLLWMMNSCFPVDKTTQYPAITSGCEEDGFPTTAVIAFKYILLRNKHMLRGGTQSTPVTLTPSISHQRHNDEEEYKMPTSMWGTPRVCSSENVKDRVEALVWDLSGYGINIRWKEHQLAESSSQVLLVCMPNVFDRQGFKEEVRYHLKEMEISLCNKGKLDISLLTVPLPNFVVTWCQNRQSKGRNKTEQRLSLNNLDRFKQKGCLVCTVEAAVDTWPCFGPLWQHFHKTGMMR